jgi:AcrR family transcriptional regulator
MATRTTRSTPKQPRSQKRVDLILDTAAELFAEVGYETATTNAIAERAGISIGSLYRYFPDKETLLRAWANRYGEQICALYDQAFAGDVSALPLPALLDRLIDPFLDLYLDCPVYTHILLGADVSADIAAVNKAMEAEIIGRTADVFRCVAPHLTEARARLTATVCKACVKGLISLVTVSNDKKFRAQVTVEVKRMLAAYLKPIVREKGRAG